MNHCAEGSEPARSPHPRPTPATAQRPPRWRCRRNASTKAGSTCAQPPTGVVGGPAPAMQQGERLTVGLTQLFVIEVKIGHVEVGHFRLPPETSARPG